MTANRIAASFLLLVICAGVPASGAKRPAPRADSAARGRKLMQSYQFWPAVFPETSYTDAWKRWGLKKKPKNFEKMFRERYGLHKAPYASKYPMGLRKGKKGGIALDCLICHSGSIAGKSYVGLANASLDYQKLVDELTPKDAKKPDFGGLKLSHVRGLMSAAGATVAALSVRDNRLDMRKKPAELGVPENVPEDPPAWWLMKKEKTLYHTGMIDATSSRSIMIFLLDPRNDGKTIQAEQARFQDVRNYLMSLKPPKYPFKINKPLAAKGKALFIDNCSECHGTYSPKGEYPNVIVPLARIQTDPARLKAYSAKARDHYNAGWLGQIDKMKAPKGYQAPPLDGVWATAPYLHNGSVPTVYHLLNSKNRPKVFTRSFRTGEQDYDKGKMGWKIRPPGRKVPPSWIHDTRKPGLTNTGHTFGDHLKDAQRYAIIEYLKTL